VSSTLDIRDLELSALLEITQAINNNLSEDDLYKIYRFTVLADLKVNRMLLYVQGASWECKVRFGEESTDQAPDLPERYKDLRDPETGIEGDTFNQYDLVFPVRHKDRLLAVVFVGGLSGDSAINTTFFRALTNILIVAIENKKLARQQLQQEAYRKELEIAKKVQNFLFPKSLPQSDLLKIEAVYLPHHDVGGDYYDYIKIDENKFVLCIADVSGKGVPAALLMSNFQASLRALLRKTNDLEEVVRELNHATFVSSNAENFITVFIGIYDRAAKIFQYANCGHNPTIIVRPGYEPLMLETGTTIIGMFDPLPFLNIGEEKDLENFVFFGYTDGLTEACNAIGDQFGFERVVELLNRPFEDFQELHQRLFTALDKFREGTPYDDDITIMSCQVAN
jgi:sigma-B regulation protein RsbU (phosphoserine phosphatase)